MKERKSRMQTQNSINFNKSDLDKVEDDKYTNQVESNDDNNKNEKEEDLVETENN
jgi:hypothetical protein